MEGRSLRGLALSVSLFFFPELLSASLLSESLLSDDLLSELMESLEGLCFH